MMASVTHDAILIDGNLAAAEVKDSLRPRIAALTALGRTPGLGTVLVGDDPGSRSYVAGKHRDCDEVGIEDRKSTRLNSSHPV